MTSSFQWCGNVFWTVGGGIKYIRLSPKLLSN